MAQQDSLYQPFPMQGRARAQVWRHEPRTRRPRHFHDEPELNLITAGCGRFAVGDVELAVGPGDLLSFAPGQDHVMLEQSPDFELYVFALEPALSARALEGRASRLYAGPAHVRLSPAETAELRAACSGPLGHEAGAAEPHLVATWRRAQELRARRAETHVLTRRTLDALATEPQLSRGSLAEQARAAPSEVSRRFHRDMGMTLGQYRARLRVLRFIRLIDGGAGSMIAAALDAGFGSYSQCHRAFRRALGLSPRAFFTTDARRRMADRFDPWA